MSEWTTTTISDSFICVAGEWIRSSEIVRLSPVFDQSYAPAQFKHTVIGLRNAQEITVTTPPREILDLLTGEES